MTKFSILNAFLILTLLFVSNVAIAAESSTPSPVTGRIPVATVNIDSARIISQKDNVFNIVFALSNKTGLQSGLKYGIQLVSDSAKYVVDEKVYDESLNLNENTNINRSVIYTAPNQLSGNYNIILMVSNGSSFPFGAISVGKVKLSATKKGLEIINDSCYLQVEGEKGSPHYSPSQSIDINDTELLRLTCTAINGLNTPLSLTPFFETKHFSGYGDTAPQIGGDYKPITFAKNEKKTFSIILPKSNAPQFYNLKVTLMNSEVHSNNISISYIIRGIIGTIQKISLNKDYYDMGDKGEMSIIWSASEGNFTRGGVRSISIPEVSLNASITGDNGRVCTSSIDQPLHKDLRNPQKKIPFEVNSTCKNPKVSATLLDDKGNVLDQKDFAFISSQISKHTVKPLSTRSIIIIVVLLLVVAGLAVYMKKRKVNNVTI